MVRQERVSDDLECSREQVTSLVYLVSGDV